MSWIMQFISAILMAFGLGSFADVVGPKADKTPVAAVGTAELGDMLTQLGFKPEPQKIGDEIIDSYKIEVPADLFTMPVYLQLAADQQSLTITAELSPLGNLEGISTADLVDLLAQNNLTNSPYVLGVNEHNVLTLQITEPLAGLSATNLKDALDQLQQSVNESALLWYFSYPAAPPADGAPSMV